MTKCNIYITNKLCRFAKQVFSGMWNKTMKTSKWDIAESLDTKEDVIAHLTVALEENDIDFLLSVLNALARSKGMAQIAAELGVSREGLYKSLASGSNPAFGTVVKTLDSLGFKLNIELKHAS